MIVCVANDGQSALLRGVFRCQQRLTRDQFARQYGMTNPYWDFLKDNNIENTGAGVFYQLEESDILADLRDRLVIQWAGRGWIQNNIERNILEIKPSGFVSLFPGWDRVLLTYQELKEIIANKEGNRSWYEFLSTHLGVYIILDTQTRQHYVGSATGRGGIWERWEAYAKNGHGENNGLIELLGGKLDRADSFKFSIIHVFTRGTTELTVKEYESLVKRKLMSSLNRN